MRDRHDEHEWRAAVNAGSGWKVGRHWLAPPPATRNHNPSLLVRALRWIWAHC